MRALVVGLGSIGRRHARNLASLGHEVDVCRQVGAAQPEPLGVDAREFNRLQAALEAEPDVVIVTNPTSLHVETAGQAIEAGAHVLIEKPIGHALEGVARPPGVGASEDSGSSAWATTCGFIQAWLGCESCCIGVRLGNP